MPVISSRNFVQSWLRVLAATAESPQVKLETRGTRSPSRCSADRTDRARRTAGRRGLQHRMGRKESGEHDDVAEQKDPEAIADDDPLGSRAAFAVAGRMIAPPCRPMGAEPNRCDRACTDRSRRARRGSVSVALMPAPCGCLSLQPLLPRSSALRSYARLPPPG